MKQNQTGLGLFNKSIDQIITEICILLEEFDKEGENMKKLLMVLVEYGSQFKNYTILFSKVMIINELLDALKAYYKIRNLDFDKLEDWLKDQTLNNFLKINIGLQIGFY